MRIINFSHPLTEQNLREIENLTGCPVSEVIEVPSQVDLQSPLEPQIASRLDELGLSSRDWQTEPLLLNLPSLNCSAAVVLVIVHGRMGYFPPVLRLRPDNDGLVPRFTVAEILNLQAIRERARGKR
ncbi:CRISPR-associated protein Csx15 [Desulfofundulus thermocisternus]|uniref:CRISPR-associated protein Csx15 n=1 Tax=Desulfofundulus thermocisternus TaxID=42471 RepID=UPI00048436D8|nr:CRISPR-associated protein Csx15 [Desulfofundulus thermocisternus]